MPLSREDHRLWRKRIEDAEGFQAKEYPRWQRMNDLYSMQYWKDQGMTFSWEDTLVPVNYATTFIGTMLSAIFSRNPKLDVENRRERYAKFALTMQDVLERHWDEKNIKEVFLDVVLDTLIFGIGWIELGMVPSEARQRVPTAQPSLGRRLFPFRQEKRPAEQGELEELKVRGALFAVRRSPYDVLVPQGPRSYWNLPYLIVHDRLMVEDFLANPSFKAKDRIGRGKVLQKDGRATMVGPKFTFGGGSQKPEATDAIIDLYTIWDKRSDAVFTISKESEEAHKEPANWPYYSEGFPVIPLMFNKMPNTNLESRFYPFGDIDPIAGQVIEKAKLRTQMVEHRRRSNVPVFVQKGSNTEEELRNYAGATGAYEVIPVTNIQTLQVGQPAQVPQAIFQTEAAIDADLHRDSGLQLLISDIAQAGKIQRATVATIVQGTASLKTGYRVDRIEAFAKHVGRYQTGLLWQFKNRFDIGEILGRLPSEEEWIELPGDPEVARRRVREELELRIEAGSTRPLQEDVLEREQYLRWGAIFQSTSPQLFKRIERKFHAGLAKRFREPQIEDLVMQAIDERAREEAQQENALMAQGNQQTVRVSDDHEIHLQVHGQLSQQVAGQEPMSQIVDQHVADHAQALQTLQAGARGAGQGVRQANQSPSAAEVGQMGTPAFSDIEGQSMNLRENLGGGV